MAFTLLSFLNTPNRRNRPTPWPAQVLSVRSALWQILNATSHPQRLHIIVFFSSPPNAQVLSVRSALWQILNATSHPQRLIYVPNDDPRILSDFLHVSLFGHRCEWVWGCWRAGVNGVGLVERMCEQCGLGGQGVWG